MRRALLALLALGILGTGIDLLLLEHTEGAWQLEPLILSAAGAVVIAWHAVDRGRLSLQFLRAIMLLFVASGVAGVLLHYRGNVEFELEMTPTLRGFELFKRTMMGATPALAPGTMILLGLTGLVYAFRHPALRRTGGTPAPNEGCL